MAPSLLRNKGRYLLAAACIALLCPVTAYAAGSLSVEDVVGTPGSVVTVRVLADAGVTLAGLKVRLNFDPSLTVGENGVRNGTLLTGQMSVNATVPGAVTVVFASDANGSGPKTLMSLDFKIPGGAVAEYPIGLKVVEASDVGLKDVVITAAGGTIRVNRTPMAQSLAVTTMQDTPVAISLRANDPDGDELTYIIDTPPLKGKLTDGTSPDRTYTPDPGYTGIDSFTYHASDGMANSGAAKVTVTVINRPPVLKVPPAQGGAEGAELKFTVSATDPDGDAATLSATDLPVGASFTAATGNFNWTPSFTQAGGYTVTFTATDAKGLTDTQSVVVTVVDVNRPPVLTVPPAQTGAENSPINFSVSAVDPDGDAVTFSAAELPAGATLNAATGVFTWTPTYTQADSYTVNFTATDAKAAKDTKAVVLSITDVNRRPVLTVPGPQTEKEGTELKFSISASDPDEDVVTLSAKDLPQGVTFTAATGTFNWTPAYDQAGSYTVAFTATDAKGLAETKSVTLTIADVNRKPVLTVPPAQPGKEGVALVFTVSSTDPDGDAVTLSAASLPQGATFTAATGTFSWTPSYTQARDYMVSFTAADAKGLTDTQNVAITVAKETDTPVISDHTATPTQLPSQGGEVALSVKVTDPNGIGSVTATVGKPDGTNETIPLALTDADLYTGHFTAGSNATVMVQTYSVKVKAVDTKDNAAEVALSPDVTVAPPSPMVTPGEATVIAGQTQRFAVSPDPEAKWSLEAEGNPDPADPLVVGVIDPDGTYHAPASVSLDRTVIVRMRGQEGRTAIATVHLLSPLLISPEKVTLKPGEAVTFTLTPNVPVNWSVEGDGTFDEKTATYTAPGSVLEAHTVKVTAKDSAGRSATAEVSLLPDEKPLCGDADLSGSVDVSDAVKVLQSIVGLTKLTPDQFRAADSDGSGGVDVSDAVKILQIVVGLAQPCDSASPLPLLDSPG